MASTTDRAPSKEAPWKSLFVKHMNAMPSPEFVLATLAAAPALHDPDAPHTVTPYLPRARFCIYRGMWAELPENKHNDAEKNPHVFESELPTFTTDVRMGKVEELFKSSPGQAVKREQCMGSGGGGPVEAVWWVNVQPEEEGKEKIMSQWRVRGEAFVVGPDIEQEGEQTSGVRTVKSEIGARMRTVQDGQEGDWSWDKEVRALFGNQSPGIQSSFKQPPPGQEVHKPYDDRKLSLGAKVDGLDDAVARSNFRVVIIKPEFVERVDLSDPKAARRYVYEFDDKTNDWKYEEQWP